MTPSSSSLTLSSDVNIILIPLCFLAPLAENFRLSELLNSSTIWFLLVSEGYTLSDLPSSNSLTLSLISESSSLSCCEVPWWPCIWFSIVFEIEVRRPIRAEKSTPELARWDKLKGSSYAALSSQVLSLLLLPAESPERLNLSEKQAFSDLSLSLMFKRLGF